MEMSDEIIRRKERERYYSLEDIAQTVTLSKDILKYDTWTTAVQLVAQLLHASYPVSYFKKGISIKYVTINSFKRILIPAELKVSKDKYKFTSKIPLELYNKEPLDIDYLEELIDKVFTQIL